MVHLLVGLALTGCFGDQRQVDIQQSPVIGDKRKEADSYEPAVG